MKKFSDAFCGLRECLKHRAVLFQFLLGFLAVLGGFLIRLDHYEWLAFILCIGLVIASEVANTAIEKLCDFVSEEYSEKIREIKDISAAMVLISSLSALAVCIVTVLRRIP